MGRVLVGFCRSGVRIGLVENKAGGVFGVLQHIETQVARLTHRILVVVAAGLDKGLNAARLDVYVDQGDVHARLLPS